MVRVATEGVVVQYQHSQAVRKDRNRTAQPSTACIKDGQVLESGKSLGKGPAEVIV